MNTNEALTRRWFEEGWGQRQIEVFKELAPKKLDQVTLATGPVVDIDEFLQFYEELTHGLPDIKLEIEHLVVTEDGTVTSWRFTGTHQNEVFGVPASGRSVEATGTTWQTIRDGKIVGGMDHWDFGSFCASLA